MDALRVSKDKHKNSILSCTTNRNGTYISSNDMELVRQLAQKKYNQSILKKAEIRLKQVKKITRDYSDDEIEQIYDKLHKERQLLVMPIEPTWEQKLAQWDGETYQGKEFYEGTAVIITEKGERVRSKSEKILADYFYRNNIIYKYEKPLFLKGMVRYIRIFTFLSRKTGEEIYWEHEGMMDKSDYAKTAVKKLESYQKTVSI